MTMIHTRLRHGARRWRAAFAALVPLGALLGVVALASPASAAPAGGPLLPFASPEPLYSAWAHMCMDNRGALLNNYNAVQIYPCNGTGAQSWLFVPEGGNFDGIPEYQAELNSTNMCLDIYAGFTYNGNSVDLYRCNGTGAQQWVPWFNGNGEGLYNPQSGKCLDDPNWSQNASTQLDIWTCNGGQNQQWQF
jgi:Ricin-type beta-trefoil lectin domain